MSTNNTSDVSLSSCLTRDLT